MNSYMIDCGDWGNCRVDAKTKAKAKYKAYLKWADAYRPNDKNPFFKFLKCIKSISIIDKNIERNDPT